MIKNQKSKPLKSNKYLKVRSVWSKPLFNAEQIQTVQQAIVFGQILVEVKMTSKEMAITKQFYIEPSQTTVHQ